MATSKRALGKGLSAIISSSTTPVDDVEKVFVEGDSKRIIQIPLEKISANPDQPRTKFDEDDLQGLSESIKSSGLIQPISVRKKDGKYFIIAGERRFRATKLAGLDTIEAIVIEVSEQENVTIALIENIQRADLDPIEEAKAFKLLINRFKLKQQEVAERVGKERATITNSIRLLQLPELVQKGISEGLIRSGHAKALLGLTSKDKQKEIFKLIIEKRLSVREVEAIVKQIKEFEESGEQSGSKILQKLKEPHIKQMEDSLVSVLGTKVEIKHSGNKGKIEISYYSLDDFERLVDILK